MEPDVATVQELSSWDPHRLSTSLRSLTSSSRAESARAARDAGVLASMAEQVPRVLGDERGGSAWTSFLREVAVARRCSDRTAAADIARAVQLVRLPRTLSLLAGGDLPVAQMRALVEESWPAGPDALACIDAEVAHRAVRLSPSRVRDAVRKVLLREEADAAAVRAAKATALRSGRRTALRDDQAEVAFTGPAVPLAQAWDALDNDARALRAAGDGRTLDALRFDLAVGRLQGDRRYSPLVGTDPDLSVQDPGDLPATGADAPGVHQPDVHQPDVHQPRAHQPGAHGPGVDEPGAHQPDIGRCGLSGSRTPASPAAATGGPDWLSDRRCARPVRMNIVFPVTSALGLSNEPGWLDGHGWISAPTCRQLLVSAELRRLCVDVRTGRLVDLAEDVVRPDPTATGVAAALCDMAVAGAPLSKTVWAEQPQHDPSDRLREFVVLRDGLCDGPTGARVDARRAHLDHDRPWPDGPTAAWNLVARGERTHALKHRGWTPLRSASSTLWRSPAGQVVEVPHTSEPLRPLDGDARLPDPAALFILEAELLRPPTRDDDPPDW